MPKEIERKFLVRQVPKECQTGVQIIQGYLCKDPAVRVRLKGRHLAYLTVKSKGLLFRDEFEYEIPRADGDQLIKMCPKTLTKLRFTLEYQGRVWEVDSFLDGLSGLCLAEVEIPSVSTVVDIPSWVGPEVTYDDRYSNIRLIEEGIPLV